MFKRIEKLFRKELPIVEPKGFNEEAIDSIRDIAIKLEDVDLGISTQLMSIAHVARPQGAFIKKKLDEYSEKKATHRRLMQSFSCDGKPRAVLKLRSAGIGDMLSQMSKFYWACEYHGFVGKVYFEGENRRNELGVDEFFELLNLSEENVRVSFFNSDASRSFVAFYDDESFRYEDLSEVLYLNFDNESYSVPSIPDIKDKCLDIHPVLCRVIQQSALYKKVKRQKNRRTKTTVCLHVRRGDIAQVPASLIRNLLKDEISSDMILSPEGVFHPDEIQSQIGDVNYNRFRSIERHMFVLDKNLKGIEEDVDIILLSDGMTQLARNLKTNHNHIFKNSTISAWKIERELEKELAPLVERSSFCLIGEGHNLIDSIVAGTSSDYVISRSPGFLAAISRSFELGTKIVYI